VFVPMVPCRLFDTRPTPDTAGPRSCSRRWTASSRSGPVAGTVEISTLASKCAMAPVMLPDGVRVLSVVGTSPTSLLA